MNTHSKSFKLYVVLSVLVLLSLICLSVLYVQNKTTSNSPKTEFGTKLPSNFPTNIPVEKGIQFTQSYSLAYQNKQQMSIVFSSAKPIAENYALYTDFLKTDGWTVSNKYQSPVVASLYATKSGADINITISNPVASSTSAQSQVSISVLINNTK